MMTIGFFGFNFNLTFLFLFCNKKLPTCQKAGIGSFVFLVCALHSPLFCLYNKVGQTKETLRITYILSKALIRFSILGCVLNQLSPFFLKGLVKYMAAEFLSATLDGALREIIFNALISA